MVPFGFEFGLGLQLLGVVVVLCVLTSIQADFMCRFLNAASLASRVSFQVGWGWYLPCGIGMKSFMGRPNTHIAGDSFCYWVRRVSILEYGSL